MNKEFKKHLLLWIAMILLHVVCLGQAVNGAYVKTLYAKYPTVKSNFCPACRLWVNPYLKSIADTVKNYPVVEHVVVTPADVQAQQAANIPRTGVYANWNTTPGAIKYDDLYSWINKQINKPMSVFEIVYGHCAGAWILMARDANGAIISDTETYCEFGEYQGQNIGTMINTEDTCRILLGATIYHGKTPTKYPVKTQQIDIWAGCVSNIDPKHPSKIYSNNGKSLTIPDVVWKVLTFNNQTIVYWMPNLPTEIQALTSQRHITYAELVKRLGFDPEKTLK